MSKRRGRAKPRACAAHEHGALAVCLLCLIGLFASLMCFSSGNGVSHVQMSLALQERDKAILGLAEKVIELEGRLKRGAK